MLVALFVLASVDAHALSDADVSARLQFIEQRLESGTSNAKLWFGLWTAGYGALTAGSGALALALPDREKKIAYTASAAASLIGFLSMVVVPMPAAFASGRLSALPEVKCR